MGGWLADCVMYVGMSGDKGHGTRNLGQGVGAGSRGGGRDQGPGRLAGSFARGYWAGICEAIIGCQ